MRNSLKKSFFAKDVEGTKSPQNYERYFSGNYFRNTFVSEGNLKRFLGISCQRVGK